MQDVACPNLLSSPFWTSYLIWQLSTLMNLVDLTLIELNLLPMRGRWACTMYRCSAHVCSDTASTACLCAHSLVCQRSPEGRGVQYLKPGFMAVDIPILTCTHAVNPVVHPKCLQWTGLGAHIPMSPPITTTLDLASCPSRDVCDDITLLHSIGPWKLAEVSKCPSGLYIYGNLELENCGHTGGLHSWNSALGRRLRVQVPGCGSFSPVATFKLCS